MNIVDVIIIVIVVLAVIRGVQAGFFRQLGSLGGFLVGLALGSWIAPIITRFISGSTTRGIITVVVAFAVAFGFASLGEWGGLHLARLAVRFKLGHLDAVLGAVFGFAVMIVSVWLVAGLVLNLQQTNIDSQINGSAILRYLDSKLPPAPSVITRLGRVFAPNGFPQVFAGLEPTPGAPLPPPSQSAIRAAFDRDAASIVKIEGPGCGGLVEGSGFVAAPGEVITNAHVVAGVLAPEVLDQKGRHAARVVFFDPNLDLAILRTSGLAGAPLTIDASDQTRGTNGAVLGYPGGGPLTAQPSVILAQIQAVGRNIYDRGLVTRSVYELQAVVQPGNSGGPLVGLDGTVEGVVFARSGSSDTIGYALAASRVAAEFADAKDNTAPVSTGRCAAD